MLRGTIVFLATDLLDPPPDSTGRFLEMDRDDRDGHVPIVPHVEGIIHVKTHYDAANKIATISVLDNGPGIPENQIATIFQPFHSSKGNAGTGLGLAVAKKVLDEHRGRIEVASNPVDGTVFSLQIPAAEGAKFDSTDTLGAVQRSSTAG